MARGYNVDGYVNMLNKYGTSRDNSNAYQFQREFFVPDMQLTAQYESNGLFSKIIDKPAEEATKHGFNLGITTADTEKVIVETLDNLDWEESAATAIKWCRLYGGAIIVMFIDDGRGLDEPLNYRAIRGIDELRVFERAIVVPDYASLYTINPELSSRVQKSKFGQPEYYLVSSLYGSFRVHESRCLIFRNGHLPQNSFQTNYRYWGLPEYVRISKALQETITSHGYSVRLLERSVQAIYSMKGLADLLSTDSGEDTILKRMQIIDMARGILNSIAIDADGENYDFKTITFSGVKEVVDATCNMLSAVTDIPQTVLFGKSPTGLNATGESDFENFYNMVERIQKLQLLGNIRTLVDIIIRGMMSNGKIDETPEVKIEFSPLWSQSETEKADVEHKKAQTTHIKAQAAQLYVDIGALGPSEVRKGLKAEGEFQVETLLDEIDADEEMWPVGNIDEPNTVAEEKRLYTDEDVEWKTVNGAPVPFKDGEPKGSVGKKIKESAKSFSELMGKEYTGVKGKDAVDKLMHEKQGWVSDAFYREDIGGIDLFYGDETAGLCHIVNQRRMQGKNPNKLLSDLAAVIENGKLGKNENSDKKANIFYKGKVVVVAYELRDKETTAVLTAFYSN